MTHEDLLFFIMAGLLSTHELDAVQNHEWRVLPLTSWLSDDVGRAVFLVAHIPLFLLVTWIVSQGSTALPALTLSVFSVLHVGLHWAFRNHPKYEFDSIFSRFLIWGAGAFGLAHLLAGALD